MGYVDSRNLPYLKKMPSKAVFMHKINNCLLFFGKNCPFYNFFSCLVDTLVKMYGLYLTFSVF